MPFSEQRDQAVAEEKCTRVNDAEILLLRRRRKRSRHSRTEVYTDINSKCHICFYNTGCLGINSRFIRSIEMISKQRSKVVGTQFSLAKVRRP